MLAKFQNIIASGFGVGYIPKAPGTFGSILGLALSLVVFYIQPSALKFFIKIMFFLGIWVTYGVIKCSKNKDPQFVVVDEIVGMGLTLFFSYKILGHLSLFSIILSFVFFRLFDIWKPWPISPIESYCEKSEKFAAFGVMIDDVLAAFYAAGVMVAMSLLFSEEIFWSQRFPDGF